MAATIAVFAQYREPTDNSHKDLMTFNESQAKKSPISLMRSIGLQHSGATSAKGGSMRVEP
jgi:hypothetical protein